MMNRLRAVALMTAGAIVGAGGYWGWQNARLMAALSSPQPAGGAETSVRRAPAMSTADASAQRAAHYQDLASIEQVSSLPSAFARREALYTVAGRADATTLRSLIEEARRIPDNAARRQTLEILLLRELELDPGAALLGQSIAAASSLPTAAGRRAELTEIARVWARVAPEKAWDQASHLEDPSARGLFREAIVAAWAQDQPDTAFARVAELPESKQSNQMLREVAEQLAARDPRHAIELLGSIAPARARELQPAIATSWARTDASAAARWVETLPFADRGSSSFPIAGYYVEQQPAEALAWALKTSRSVQRNLWATMLGAMAEQNPEEALRIAQSAESPIQRTRAISEIVSTISQRDPDAAMAAAEKLTGNRGEAVREIGRKVGERSADAALAWLENLKESPTRQLAASGVASMLAERDPDAAIAMLDRVPKDLRGPWISTTTFALRVAEPEQATQWLAKLRDDPAYPQVASQLASALASRDPEAALDIAERLDARARDGALFSMVTTIVHSSPETAVRWIDRISDPGMRDSATAQVASNWSAYDPPAARKWALSLQPTPGRDQTLVQIAASEDAASVEDRLSLIDQIQQPALRTNAVLRAAMAMRLSDPEGSRTLLRRRPLDPGSQKMYDDWLRQTGR